MKKSKYSVLLVTAALLLSSLTACGKKDTEDKKTDTTQTTTEAVTTQAEDIQTADDETDNRTEDTSEEETTEYYYTEDGVLHVGCVSMTIPEGYKEHSTIGKTVVYATEDSTCSFALYSESDNKYEHDDVVNAYLTQIKATYGDSCTESEQEYYGHKYTVVNVDNPDGKFYGKVAVLCEDNIVVYIEALGVEPDNGVFDYVINNISF